MFEAAGEIDGLGGVAVDLTDRKRMETVLRRSVTRLRLATEGVIEAVDGSPLRLEAQSICVHGDSPAAVAMAAAIRDRLTAEGVAIRSFAGPAA